MDKVIFFDGNHVPSLITDSPAAIWDELTGAVFGLGDLEEVEFRFNKLKDIFCKKGLYSRAEYVKLIKLPLNQEIIDKINSSECREHLRLYLKNE